MNEWIKGTTITQSGRQAAGGRGRGRGGCKPLKDFGNTNTIQQDAHLLLLSSYTCNVMPSGRLCAWQWLRDDPRPWSAPGRLARNCSQQRQRRTQSKKWKHKNSWKVSHADVRFYLRYNNKVKFVPLCNSFTRYVFNSFIHSYCYCPFFDKISIDFTGAARITFLLFLKRLIPSVAVGLRSALYWDDYQPLTRAAQLSNASSSSILKSGRSSRPRRRRQQQREPVPPPPPSSSFSPLPTTLRPIFPFFFPSFLPSFRPCLFFPFFVTW